jgi:nucleoside-diphosphate-sugar epimerase
MSTSQYEALQNDCAGSAGEDIPALQPLRGAHMLITGGTGFVGTWVTQMVAYLNDCHQFGINLTLLSPHASEFSSRAPHLACRADVRLMEGDVRSLADLPSECEWIIHAAGSPDSRIHFSNPVRTMETIVSGTQALLNAASRLTPLQRVLSLSSGLVYGPQRWEDAPLSEKVFSGFDCANPARVYAESKRAAEMVAAAYRSQFGLPVLSARLFAFIGPYQLLDRPWAINNFLCDALRGGPIRVQGNGETTRSYMYGSDLAHWLLRLLVSGKIGAAYNVGSPVGISLKDLAVKIAECFSRRPSIDLNTLPAANIPRTQWLPDVTLARTDCDLRLQTSLDQAIARTVAWHTKQ